MHTTTAQDLNKSSTPRNTTEEDDYHVIYILCEIMGVINILTTVYLLICFITYGVKTGRKSGIDGGVVLLSATIAVALAIPRYILTQLILKVLYIKEGTRWCEVLHDVGNVCYFLSAYAIYAFLWVRQKVLYAHPAMKQLAGRCIQTSSWIVLIALSAAAVALVLWSVVPEDHTYNDSDCVLKNSTASGNEGGSYQAYYFGLVALVLIAQTSLLILFIYPMVRMNAVQSTDRDSSQCSGGLDVAEATTNGASSRVSKIEICFNVIRIAGKKLTTSAKGKRNTVEKTIRRSVFSALITMVCDILAMALGSFALSRNRNSSWLVTVYDVGLSISVLCILGTFTSHSDILKVFCRRSSGRSQKKTTSVGYIVTSAGRTHPREP